MSTNYFTSTTPFTANHIFFTLLLSLSLLVLQAAVETFLQTFVREHTAQLSADWLRRKMGATPILGMGCQIGARRNVDHVLSVNHFEKPRLQYVSYLDGTVFDTAMLEPQRPQQNPQQHSEHAEPLAILEPSLWERGGSCESAEHWAAAAIGDGARAGGGGRNEQAEVEPQALPEGTTPVASSALPAPGKPKKRTNSVAVNSLRRRVVKFD